MKGVICVLLLVSRAAVAQVETKLLPTLDIGDEQFGLAVSAVEDRIVVGAYLDDAAGLYNAGAVYVYDFDGTTWQETAKLTPSDQEAGDLFGASVLFASDRLFVLSLGKKVVYLFEWDGATWQEVESVPDTAWPELARQEGIEGNLQPNVALSGNTLAVGSITKKNVLLYHWDGSAWVQTQELTLRPNTDDEFGGAVALDGDRLVVRAGRGCSKLAVYSPMGETWTLQEEIDFQSATSCREIDLRGEEMVLATPLPTAIPNARVGATVVRREASGWTLTASLSVVGAEKADLLGKSVAFTGTRIIIGAPYDDERGENAGAVYVFEWDGDTWQQTAKLTASDATRDGGFNPIKRFGYDVALRGDHALIADGEVTVYLFTHAEGVWREAAKITPQEESPEEGNQPPSVALNDRWAFMGFPKARSSSSQKGVVYVYQRQDTTWSYTTTLTPADRDRWSGFGKKVQLYGDEAIITVAEAAYLFGWDGTAWNQTAVLTASGSGFGFVFPNSVAMNERWAFASAQRYEPPYGIFVYVYERRDGVWVEVDILSGSEESYGHALAVQGNRLLVGAKESAYVYDWDGEAWQETARLPLEPGLEFVPFAHSSIALGENLAVIGAPTFRFGSPHPIQFFVREDETWNSVYQLPSDLTGKDRFGYAISLDGDRLLTSAQGEGASGAVYLYEGFSDLISTPVEEPEAVVPEAVRLTQNYPNPAYHFTTITYQVDQAGPTRLDVFDLLGRRVATLEDRYRLPGVYTVTFDVQRLVTGTYLYKLTTDTRIASRQMMIVR